MSKSRKNSGKGKGRGRSNSKAKRKSLGKGKPKQRKGSRRGSYHGRRIREYVREERYFLGYAIDEARKTAEVIIKRYRAKYGDGFFVRFLARMDGQWVSSALGEPGAGTDRLTGLPQNVFAVSFKGFKKRKGKLPRVAYWLFIVIPKN